MKKVKLAGKPIFKLEQQAPSTSINSDWKGSVNQRSIAPGESALLELVFTVSGQATDEQYTDLTFDMAQLNDGTPLHGGTISLQSESHPVEFRKVELLDLSED